MAVIWVCYNCRTTLPKPGQCQKCKGPLTQYPPAPTLPVSPPMPRAMGGAPGMVGGGPASMPVPEEENELLSTLKFKGVLPIPPRAAPPALRVPPPAPTAPSPPAPSLGGPAPDLSRSQELLADAFSDTGVGDEDDLQATMRFRGVMKLPPKAETKKPKPRPRVAADDANDNDDDSFQVRRAPPRAAEPEPESESEGLANMIILGTIIFSLLALVAGAIALFVS